MSNIKDISWLEVENMISDIAKQIIENGFNADSIAPIPKGGWTVAALLAQHLNIKSSISVAQEKNGDSRNTYIAGSPQIKNKNILVVEDSIETGKSLFDAKSELTKLGANVKTVCLYVSSNFNGDLPDFYYNIGEIPEFPWEIQYKL